MSKWCVEVDSGKHYFEGNYAMAVMRLKRMSKEEDCYGVLYEVTDKERAVVTAPNGKNINMKMSGEDL